MITNKMHLSNKFPAYIRQRIDDPVPVILPFDEAGLLENREVIGEFRASEVREPFDDTHAERLVFYQAKDREPQRIGERMIRFALLNKFLMGRDAFGKSFKTSPLFKIFPDLFGKVHLCISRVTGIYFTTGFFCSWHFKNM
jgi:hypothetical protein